MTQISINGKTYSVEGNNVSVINNKIYIDGKLIQDCAEIKQKNIKIIVEGNVDKLESGSSDVVINGNCTNLKSGSGDIVIKGDVHGDVTSGSGDITCKSIQGSTKTGSGDIITSTDIFSSMKCLKNIFR